MLLIPPGLDASPSKITFPPLPQNPVSYFYSSPLSMTVERYYQYEASCPRTPHYEPYCTHTRCQRLHVKKSAGLLSDRPPFTNEADNFIQDFTTPFYLARWRHKIWQLAPLKIIQDHFTNRIDVGFPTLKRKIVGCGGLWHRMK